MLSCAINPLSLFSGLIESMSTLKERIEELMRETGMDERAIAAAAGGFFTTVRRLLHCKDDLAR